MTDSTAKPTKESLDDFDNDLDALLDEAALALGGVNALRDDEDAIDRLLMDNGFDEPEGFAQNIGIKEKLVDDITLPEFDEFTGFDDEVDEFDASKNVQNIDDSREELNDSDPFTLVELNQSEAGNTMFRDDDFAEIEDLDEFADDLGEQGVKELESVYSVMEPEPTEMRSDAIADEPGDDFLQANFDIMENSESELEPEPVPVADESRVPDDALIDDAFELDVPASVPSFVQAFNDATARIKKEPYVSPAMAADSAEMEALKRFKSDQELISSQQKKRMQELDDKARKAMTFMYAGLALAGVSLISAVSMGVLAKSAKTEVARLSERVVTLDQEVKAIADTPSQNDMAPINLAMEQLNQKVDGLTGQLNGLGAASADLSKQELNDVVSKQNLANKTLAALQHKVDVLEKRKTAEVLVKSAPVKEVTSKAETAKPAVAKSATVKKKIKMESPASSAGWSVNLLALREQKQANNKAAEFAKKGIKVDVVEVVVNKQPWYRLRVPGFNSQNEAVAYSGRAKKALNLNSVWVTKN